MQVQMRITLKKSGRKVEPGMQDRPQRKPCPSKDLTSTLAGRRPPTIPGMLTPLLLLAAAGPAQTGGGAPRAEVLELLERGRAPSVYELELRVFEVEYGCELGRALVAHLERREPATAASAPEAVDFIEESADIEFGESPVRELTGDARHVRIWDGGSRRLEESLDAEGERTGATLIDGDRRAVHVPERRALQLGPRGEAASIEATEADMFPVPTAGPWLRALERTTWDRVAPRGGWRAAMDRDGRRLDVTFDVEAGEAPLPHRAVATYFGVASITNEAVLLSWERVKGRPFLTDSLRITPGEESLVVRHARRSAPRFDLDASDVKLVVPRPETVEIASSPGWQSFRRREAVPREWRDLIVVEAR